ncbi:MAG: hypothetical protein LIV22_02720 [Olegusella sp.]|nr:hypothetical protein [Olegusella sp.]NLH92327.1 hypothetical protein [Atopobium sp.]
MQESLAYSEKTDFAVDALAAVASVGRRRDTPVRSGTGHRGSSLKRACVVAVCGAVLLAASALMAPCVAFADTDDDLAAAAQEVQQTSEAYQAAEQKLNDIQSQVAENQAHIDEIEAQLPAQREKSASSIRTLYKMRQSSGGIVELILSSEDFNSLITTLQYLNVITDKNNDEVARLVAMEDDLQDTKEELEKEQSESQEAEQDAQAALEKAKASQAEVQQRAAEQAAAEKQDAEAALAQAQAKAGQTYTNASGNTATVETTSASAGTATVSFDTSSNDSVDAWAARIDAYLVGSPLAGYGHTFAQAALTYGVDPRWSPAIACEESGKGSYCFASYNAWGWGGSGWSSWDEAINAHVAGLAAGYGYTISIQAAQKYCPPNWQEWYYNVSAEMSKI